MNDPKRIDAMLNSLKNLEPLEEVPEDVSLRIQATVSELINNGRPSSKSNRWSAGGSHFAFAASFVLVIALGSLIVLNPEKDLEPTLPPTSGIVESSPESSISDSDQLLYSGGGSAVPQASKSPVVVKNSGHDYSVVPIDLIGTLNVGNTWNTPENLNSNIQKCLLNLDLLDSINLIDNANVGNEPMWAIWSPVSQKAWNVYLVTPGCEVLDKKFVQG